jgi:outer membrane lipase/esterase
VKCPAAASPALAGTCTGYGQGGSRVTDPNGIGKAGGALTVPVKTQIANHLARFGSFKASDLIVRVRRQQRHASSSSASSAATATQIQADAAAGRHHARRRPARPVPGAERGPGSHEEGRPRTGRLREERDPGQGRQVRGRAGTWTDSTSRRSAATPGRPSRCLTGLVDNFNLWLRRRPDRPAGEAVDANTQFKDAWQQPGQVRHDQHHVPACDATKIKAITGGRVTDGSSLFCNATPGRAVQRHPCNGADVNTWQFADGVHPTTGGHRMLSATEIAVKS